MSGPIQEIDGAIRKEMAKKRTKALYGLGSVAYGTKDNGFAHILLLFYNQVIGLPAQVVGTAIMIVLIIDAVLDPIVGQISDNFRSRWGRRHPFMYAAALPTALAYLFLWNPPDLSTTQMFFYLIVVASTVRFFISFYEIPSAALVPEMTNDYDQRTSFIAYRNLFAWYGGLTMSFLAFRVFLTPDAEHPVGTLNPNGYNAYGITAACIMFFTIIISAMGTHRFIPYFSKPVERKMGLADYGREMISTVRNKPFLTLMSASFLSYMSSGLAAALWVYFLTYYWELDHVGMSMITLSWFVAVMAGFWIAPPVSRHFGKRNGVMVLYPMGWLIYALPLILRLMGLFPGNDSPLLVPLLFIFTAVGASLTSASWILTPSMIADVVEDSQIRTGRRSEGLFFAGASFLQKSMSGAGVFLSGLILWIVGLPQHAKPGEVDPEIIRNLALIYLPLLALLHLGAVIIISTFSLTRESHEENLRRLAAAAEPGLE